MLSRIGFLCGRCDADVDAASDGVADVTDMMESADSGLATAAAETFAAACPGGTYVTRDALLTAEEGRESFVTASPTPPARLSDAAFSGTRLALASTPVGAATNTTSSAERSGQVCGGARRAEPRQRAVGARRPCVEVGYSRTDRFVLCE